MCTQEAVNFILERLSEDNDLQLALNKLSAEVTCRGATDNISAVAIFLNVNIE